MIVGDLKKCEMYPNWSEQAQDRSIWHCWIEAANEDVNEEMEITKQSKKDELKQRGEAVNQEQTLCSEQGCHFVGSNKASLVNHIRQIHSGATQCRYRCVHCGELYLKKGLIMHVRFCKKNPYRRAA